MAHLPYIQFYVADYLRDTRGCSLEARGLWADLLCYMHISPRRGVLLNESGEPFSLQELARIAGDTLKKTAAVMGELKRNGVYSTTDKGEVFNRRMVREARLSEVRSEAAQKRWSKPFASQNGHAKPLQASDADAVVPEPEARSKHQPPAAAAADSPRAALLSHAVGVELFPLFAAAARRQFPAVDDGLLNELLALAQAIVPAVDDEDMERVIIAATQPKQRGPALWRKTVPEVVKSWQR